MKRIQNKVVLITGAAQGIGKSIAELFIAEGAIVILTDVNDSLGEMVAKSLGGKAKFLHLDVADEENWQSVREYIKAQYVSLDVLINNAGITGFSDTQEAHDPEHASLNAWRYVHAVNLDGIFLGCKMAIELMKTKGGSIINMSSRSGIVGIPRAAAYASSKAAIRNHTKSVALYCCEEQYPIRCNSICPAAILTPMWETMLGDEINRSEAIKNISATIPMQKMGDPIDVAYAALYLATDESKYVTGTELHIDGGILAGTASSPAKAKG